MIFDSKSFVVIFMKITYSADEWVRKKRISNGQQYYIGHGE